MNRDRGLYTSPLRVYLCLGFLALVGIYCGLKLPISLFPNSSKPEIYVSVGYGGSTSEEFLNTYGRTFEGLLRNISTPGLEIDELRANYRYQNAGYDITFKWGANPQEAFKEVQIVANSFSAQFPQEMRDSLRVDMWSDNGGFLAVSFYSDRRNLDDLYKYLDPILTPLLSHVPDASGVELWNPTRKEIQIELNPEKMAALQLFPQDVQASVWDALNGNNGGTVQVGLNQLDVTMSRQAMTIDDLTRTLVKTPGNRMVHLGDIARVDLGTPITNARSFKTSGSQSLILFADPKPGGNVKRMAEDVLAAVKQVAPTLADDVHYKTLVDPSEFIRASINNVLHEVILAALLAVIVLFLFIGNLKNVVTAAIEIPLSMVLAFILMRMTGINLNLISLGGLALSAGMNVDGSVVVMENIFRHFEEHKGPLDFNSRLHVVMAAVREVRFPIIASTVASLVVFLPLAFTSGLSNALLSDLALAVVFSHAFSAIVALILVPTVRLHLMTGGAATHGKSPLEKIFKKAESLYSRALDTFMRRGRLKFAFYAGLAGTLALLAFLVLPRLPKEIVGRPDTDWIILSVMTEGNTMARQMEVQTDEVEARLLKQFGDRILYTFTQVRGPQSGHIMARLKDKRGMNKMWNEMQNFFTNTPTLKYWVEPWNPSELHIPNPPQFQLGIRGGDKMDRARVGRQIKYALEEKQLFPYIGSDPSLDRQETISMTPNQEQWAVLEKSGVRATPAALADLSRVATLGHRVGSLPVEGKIVPVVMMFPPNRVSSPEDLGTLPVGVNGKLVPLKALARLDLKEIPPALLRVNENEIIYLSGKMNQGEEAKAPAAVKQVTDYVNSWKAQQKAENPVSVTFEDPDKELNDALRQLSFAVGLSILLIFITMVLQFGSIVNALLVLVAVPLGFIGVLASLYVFKSTLSLNSVLGVILLNGIAVANSIILVDFLKRLVDEGLSPREAALTAAQKRLRPILMTSLTTALGMLPVAFGFGEGGRILQPLGITVIGGLGFSMMMTLFIVPALQVAYLERRLAKRRPVLELASDAAVAAVTEAAEVAAQNLEVR